MRAMPWARQPPHCGCEVFDAVIEYDPERRTVPRTGTCTDLCGMPSFTKCAIPVGNAGTGRPRIGAVRASGFPGQPVFQEQQDILLRHLSRSTSRPAAPSGPVVYENLYWMPCRCSTTGFGMQTGAENRLHRVPYEDKFANGELDVHGPSNQNLRGLNTFVMGISGSRTHPAPWGRPVRSKTLRRVAECAGF